MIYGYNKINMYNIYEIVYNIHNYMELKPICEGLKCKVAQQNVFFIKET